MKSVLTELRKIKIRGAVERGLSGADLSAYFFHHPLHLSALRNCLDSERVLIAKLSKRYLNTWLAVQMQYVIGCKPFEQILRKKSSLKDGKIPIQAAQARRSTDASIIIARIECDQ